MEGIKGDKGEGGILLGLDLKEKVKWAKKAFLDFLDFREIKELKEMQVKSDLKDFLAERYEKYWRIITNRCRYSYYFP